MSKQNKSKKKVFRSLKELEEVLLPNFHEQKLIEERSKKPEIYGTGLATEFLKRIERQLVKRN